MSYRRAEIRPQQQRTCNRIDSALHEIDAVDFFNVLTGPQLLEHTEAHLPEHRERLYPPTVTLAMFMRQALSKDRSCQRAVNGWAAQRMSEGLKPNSADTGAYCRARQRLPVEMVKALTRESGRLLSAKALPGWRWHGRAVKLVDGSTISMPDTPQNQVSYPQPGTQAAGVGFPLARVLAVICLSTGAALEAAVGPYAGTGNSELGLLQSLGEVFNAGDVMLADSFYCNYFIIATLQAAGVDALFEQHRQRIIDVRRGRPLGARDYCAQWPKPDRPPWMTREQYASFPETLSVRELQRNGRVLLTTLRDRRQVSKQQLFDLYRRRWQVELDLRNIKVTLGVDVLSCRSPKMVIKEWWVHLLAYNLIRLLMAQAAAAHDVQPRQLSFKHTVQLWTEWTARRLTHRAARHADLWQLLAQVRVADRPGRVEPRMKKRRPKSYPWMKRPRSQERARIMYNIKATA